MILGSSGGIGFEWYLKYVRKTGLARFCVGPNGKRGSRNVLIVRTPLCILLFSVALIVRVTAHEKRK